MKIFYLSILFVLGFATCNCQSLHPMPVMGNTYVRQRNHMDSSLKYADSYKWNHDKSYGDSMEKEIIRQVKMDSAEEMAYRVKFHFVDYYYMWNYTDGDDHGWGENDIMLDHRPTKREIKDYVLNTMLKYEKGNRYRCLEIVDVVEKTSNPNSIENIPSTQKGQLNYSRSIHRQLTHH